MKEAISRHVVHKGSVTYFTKHFERTLFCIMTLIMLGWGIGEKLFAYVTG